MMRDFIVLAWVAAAIQMYAAAAGVEGWENAYNLLMSDTGRALMLTQMAWESFQKRGRGAIYAKFGDPKLQQPGPQGQIDIGWVTHDQFHNSSDLAKVISSYDPEKAFIIIVRVGDNMGFRILEPSVPPPMCVNVTLPGGRSRYPEGMDLHLELSAMEPSSGIGQHLVAVLYSLASFGLLSAGLRKLRNFKHIADAARVPLIDNPSDSAASACPTTAEH
eukprot:gnl/TRDRNA2_/TRDRNA2_90853_c0_seq1.p1 gnl/TRDRNA2_/TRDRNA2_90853_c0~~gnl/TRDRNA2_/TRDRNA2_90853_c0_seq1.p1  ORF type:complete len:219 (+),score=30.09 gnl/TRDRNA2_/TRDRNA2_90853_c0_seq1:51-707(+)